jgi:hypothetical protein
MKPAALPDNPIFDLQTHSLIDVVRPACGQCRAISKPEPT